MSNGKFSLAIVTGGAHRLGRVFSLTLARLGYAVLVHYYRSQEDAEKISQEISTHGVPVITKKADLTRDHQITELFEQADLADYPLEVLVNSAAIMTRGNVRSFPVDSWDATFDLNLRAAFLCSQQAANRMRKGLIVNITDVGAQKTWSGFPAYTASKCALEALTRILARSLAPDIRVNAIAPGLVLPFKDFPVQEWQNLIERIPLHRQADPSEIASAFEYLLKNEYITGQTIVVDGGYSLIS